MNKIPLDVVVGHLKENLNKERKQYNLARKSLDQLDYMFNATPQSRYCSRSAIVEQALDAYFKIFKVVEMLKERGEHE